MNPRKMMAVMTMVGGLVLAACAPASSVDNTSWQLVNLGGNAADGSTQVTLNLAGGKISGSDGCNNYGGTYTQNGNQIKINDDIMSTLMACADPIMQQADAYMKALTQATTHKLVAQQFMLLSADGTTLATFNAQSRDLSGTSWVVTGYNNGKQAVISVVNGSELTANFGADRKLSGSAGCNNFTSTYEIKDKSVKIGPTATTRKMCASPEGVMEQETQFLKALETAATFSLDGSRLEMRSADGALTVTFERAS